MVKNGKTLEFTTPKLSKKGDSVTFEYPSDYHRKYLEVDNAMYHLCSQRDTVYVCVKETDDFVSMIKGVFDFRKKTRQLG